MQNTQKKANGRLGARVLRHLTLFRRDEEGSMIIFAMFIFITMLIVAGIAVDLMRFESNRSRLQATLDRAVLASSDLEQTLDPESVVRDYFDKAGLLNQLDSIVVTEGFNSRSVQATASLGVDMMFMPLIGIDHMTAPAAGTAIETVENIEISLVLDISGSMRDFNRMNRLRPAASEFVSTVISAAEPDTLSINLVPYAGQTNPGPIMFSYLNGVRYPQPMIANLATADPNDLIPFPSNSSCLEVPPTAFNDNLPTNGLAQTPMFMNWAIAANVMDWGWCPTDSNSIIYASNNIAALTGRINSMRMHDGTGTHYAMRWGVSLLNPNARPAFAHLASQGAISSVFAGIRPLAYNSTDGMKVIVLMTDGQITEQTRPVQHQHALNPFTELQRRPSNQRINITSANTNVNSFYTMCNLAKSDGIIIFTIAFEAPGAASTQMANCASSPSHFYSVSGLDIGTAFRSIANQINSLRLIQ